jgi:hypothetical protein
VTEPVLPSIGNARTGHGRWTAVQKPAMGVLWVSELGTVGFLASHGEDGSPVTALIDTCLQTDDTADQAFDKLAALIGSRVDTGRLDDWRIDRAERERL